MTLETNRLLLIPLVSSQLDNWINDIEKLEQQLDCTYKAEPMEGFFREIVKGQFEIVKKDSSNYVWHTFWLIKLKSTKEIVGSSDFKNLPDERGRVEIGYGLGETFRHKGYMTEAVREMIHWAFQQKNVSEIIAETENDNQPSKNILINCGFNKVSQGDTCWFSLIKS